ncbi:hypothetical protein N7532_004281 [Penicillium argentinense]|uniref:Uncharacterized protein n=1 Tax=Penicillium argentinense TaxID=1131581 RepID=A0A9W9FP23_9EURO|nr:uncharacterized protein N7532_004281 [Penicillium argentinense]KAJ5103752.1 hypothetical protein N7532_004281 [Penicillium argentinense]
MHLRWRSSTGAFFAITDALGMVPPTSVASEEFYRREPRVGSAMRNGGNTSTKRSPPTPGHLPGIPLALFLAQARLPSARVSLKEDAGAGALGFPPDPAKVKVFG